MKFRELIEEVALETDVKPPKARRIIMSLLSKIEQTLAEDQVLRTPSMIFRPVTGKEDSNKIGVIRINPKKLES
tara:strand:- start:517 stop:738 length:222 start_codon:yes stop_codon:yes gene_type:complete